MSFYAILQSAKHAAAPEPGTALFCEGCRNLIAGRCVKPDAELIIRTDTGELPARVMLTECSRADIPIKIEPAAEVFRRLQSR